MIKMLIKLFTTETPVRSKLVQKLFYEGRGDDIQKAVENEMRGNTGRGTYNGITVKRVTRA